MSACWSRPSSPAVRRSSTRWADVQPGGATPLGAAVRRGVSYFREQAQTGTLVVVTDGEENCGDNVCQLADEIAQGQPPLEVHVIGYGLDNQQDRSLRCLPSRNGGRYTTVNTTGELIDALQADEGYPGRFAGGGEAVVCGCCVGALRGEVRAGASRPRREVTLGGKLLPILDCLSYGNLAMDLSAP